MGSYLHLLLERLDFQGDIYGHRVRVNFLHKLREEAKYPNLEALTAQIERDVQATREFLLRRRAAA
jgi:riboflavin kinase/FMN adenylyltransferase